MQDCQNKFRRLATASALVTLCLGAAPALAENWTDKLTISGFSSAVYQRSNSDVFFNGDLEEGGIDDKGSFRDTRVGLHFYAKITDRVSLASQLFASRNEHNYDSHIDWSFLSFYINEQLTLRTGKIRFPVGLVNEYRAVGYTYPWITPPQIFYNEAFNGPNVTRESYTGLSALWSRELNDWTLTADLFAGEVALDHAMTVREMSGITASANWNEMVTLQASSYTSTMYTEEPSMAAMDGEKHDSVFLGARLDWNNLIAYAEMANVDMGNFKQGEANSWYTTIGYHIGKLLPHITYQEYSEGETTTTPQKQNMTTAGLKIYATKNTAVKIEFSQIQTDSGRGLFESSPGKDVNVIGTSVDIVF